MSEEETEYLLALILAGYDALDRLQAMEWDLSIARIKISSLIRLAYRTGYTDGLLRARSLFQT